MLVAHGVMRRWWSRRLHRRRCARCSARWVHKLRWSPETGILMDVDGVALAHTRSPISAHRHLYYLVLGRRFACDSFYFVFLFPQFAYKFICSERSTLAFESEQTLIHIARWWCVVWRLNVRWHALVKWECGKDKILNRVENDVVGGSDGGVYWGNPHSIEDFILINWAKIDIPAAGCLWNYFWSFSFHQKIHPKSITEFTFVSLVGGRVGMYRQMQEKSYSVAIRAWKCQHATALTNISGQSCWIRNRFFTLAHNHDGLLVATIPKEQNPSEGKASLSHSAEREICGKTSCDCERVRHLCCRCRCYCCDDNKSRLGFN